MVVQWTLPVYTPSLIVSAVHMAIKSKRRTDKNEKDALKINGKDWLKIGNVWVKKNEKDWIKTLIVWLRKGEGWLHKWEELSQNREDPSQKKKKD